MALLSLSLVADVARAECEDHTVLVDQAVEAILVADLDTASAKLQSAETALGCGSVAQPPSLARQWLVEGVLLDFGGEDPTSSFAAARRVAPDVWIDALGAKFRASYDGADTGEGTDPTRLEASPELGESWVAHLDGKPITLPHDVVPGLHVIQVADSEGTVHFGTIVFTIEGSTQKVEHGLPQEVTPIAEEHDTTVAPPESPVDSQLWVHLGGGIHTAFGEPLTSQIPDAPNEPGMKLTVPLEAGIGWAAEPVWLRAVVGLAPMVGGRYLYATEEGPGSSPVALRGTLTGGFTLPFGDLGVMGGISWPSRLTLALVMAIPLSADLPLVLEPRVGLNVPTERSAEPALGITFVYAPEL